MNSSVLGYADTLRTNKCHPKIGFNKYSFVKLKKLSNVCVPTSDRTLPGTTK